jgi:hypothetical protein
VRVRDHILLSTAGAALLSPRLGAGAAGLWAGGVLVDVDHYVWFCIRHHRLSPCAAAQFFNAAEPPQTSATRVLHHPMTLLATAGLAVRRRALRPLALGMTLHVGLDIHHEVHMKRARSRALARDRCSCQACGTQTCQVGTHVFTQPWLLPSYGAQNVISLCSACHEHAHAVGHEVSTWT